MNMNSILDTIKRKLGIDPEYKIFDPDIITNINSAFMILNQLGVGSKEPFFVTSDKEEWSDFIQDSKNIESVKDYIFLKVKLIFDPPASSSTLEAYKGLISEIEWRLYIQEDGGTKDESV